VQMHVGCGFFFTSFLVNVSSSVHNTRAKNQVHPQFYIEAIDKNVGENYCLVAVAHVYFLRVMGRNALNAVYAKLQYERDLFMCYQASPTQLIST
jgi:hypothetical protein